MRTEIRQLSVGLKLQSANHRLRATGYLTPFSAPRARPASPAETRGPCQKRSRGIAVADAQVLKRRGPLLVHSRKPSMALRRFYRPQATSYRPPVTFTTYYAPHTTYQQGGHTGPPLRRHDTRHESRAATTGHRPLTAVSSFQPSEPLARVSQSRPAQSPSLARVVRSNGDR